ncbi:hypothetical protein [Bacillus salipaludis]|uniref:N-acetylmuramoyl-L-alanine amidase family protein n=1 Tax=Bacillus salipaludis TaxID=2547811 RepID=A0ABW8RDX2_9BACI
MKRIIALSSFLILLLMTVLPAGVSHAATAAVQLTGISVVLEDGKTIGATKVGDNQFSLNLVGDEAYGQQTIEKVIVKSLTAKTISVFPKEDENYTDELNLQFVNGEAVIDFAKFNNWMNWFLGTEGEDYPFTLDVVKTFLVPVTSEEYSDEEHKTAYSFTGFLADQAGNESPARLTVKTQDWVMVGKNWKFLDDAGQYLTGWGLVDGKWYFFGADTIMKTGWQNIGGKWYFLNANGAMVTNWFYQNGTWYYLNAKNGDMATNWASVNGKWYFFDATSGAMRTNWVYSSGKWYFLDASGAMKTGWAYTGNKWYYLNNSGAMQTGWVVVNNKWYYLYSDGHMAVNTKIGSYRVGKDGAWIR